MRIAFIIVLSLLSSLFSHSMAQTSADFSKMRTIMDLNTNHLHYTMKGTGNEAVFVLKGLFIFYKSFVSSQDGNSCSFTPSCSEYAVQAIQKKGLIIGMFAAFDRLTRCNGLSPENYAHDDEHHLLIDPVK